MGKSSSAIGRAITSHNPSSPTRRDPQALRRAHAAVHRFVEQFEAEVEDAVHSARARQLAAIKRVEQTVRYLHSRSAYRSSSGDVPQEAERVQYRARRLSRSQGPGCRAAGRLPACDPRRDRRPGAL